MDSECKTQNRPNEATESDKRDAKTEIDTIEAKTTAKGVKNLDMPETAVQLTKSDKRDAKNEIDTTEVSTTSEFVRTIDMPETSMLPTRVEDVHMNSGSSCHSDSKKRKNCHPLDESSKRRKTSKSVELIKPPVHSSTTPDNIVEIGVSSMQLTETGECFFNNMIQALRTGKLNVATFCAVLPYIDRGCWPKDEGPDQGEIDLLYDDLIRRAKTVLKEMHDGIHVRSEEDNKESEKLGLIIEEIDKCHIFSGM